MSRFNVTSLSAVSSFDAKPGDFLPRNVQGTTFCVNANSNYVGKVLADFGVGLIDVTSLFTGAGTFAGLTGVWHVGGLIPDTFRVNIQSVAGQVNVGVGFSG